MRIIVEHNGTAAHNALASGLQDILENDLSHKCDPVIGPTDTNSVSLYDENRKLIGVFTKMPKLEELLFYINISDKEEVN